MTPTCSRPYCHQPVRRAKSNEHTARGVRLENGVRYRWFCSRDCAGRVATRLNQAELQRGQELHRANARRARLHRYIAHCKAVATPDGLVPIKAMVKVLTEIERAWYARGWDAALEYGRSGRKGRQVRREQAMNELPPESSL